MPRRVKKQAFETSPQAALGRRLSCFVCERVLKSNSLLSGRLSAVYSSTGTPSPAELRPQLTWAEHLRPGPALTCALAYI